MTIICLIIILIIAIINIIFSVKRIIECNREIKVLNNHICECNKDLSSRMYGINCEDLCDIRKREKPCLRRNGHSWL